MKPIKFKFRGKRYRINPIGLALVIAIIILVIALAVFGVNKALKGKNISDADVTPEASATASVAPLDAEAYDGTVLAETEDAGSDYIKSTLFLGDSNTARFYKVADTDGNTFSDTDNTIGVVGMGIDAISTLQCMQFSTGTFTMPASVKILQPERVIITFGTNNLSGTSTDATSFIERYAAQIKTIVEAYPSVDIIVNAIPPIGQKNSYPNLSMTQITAYNAAIAKMCEDNDWKYLNSSEALVDYSTGYAKSGYMVDDGLHLSVKGLEALFDYIRTHVYITDDDRPKPLAAIPTVIGTVENLIQTNPLNDETFTEDPSVSKDCTEGQTVGENGCACYLGYTTWENKCTATNPNPATATPAAKATATASTTPDCAEGQTVSGCACKLGYITSDNKCTATNPNATPTPTPTPECGEGVVVGTNGCVCKLGYLTSGNACTATNPNPPDCAEGQTVSGCACKLGYTTSENKCTSTNPNPPATDTTETTETSTEPVTESVEEIPTT